MLLVINPSGNSDILIFILKRDISLTEIYGSLL